LVLEPQQIVRTVAVLRDRIAERFPGSGLGGLAETLAQVAGSTVPRLRWVAEPHRPLRVGIGALIALILVLLGSVFFNVISGSNASVLPTASNDLPSLIQLLESVLNDLFLVGASIFFLVTVEARIKRQSAGLPA
jgi:hypothetical protein